MAAFSFMVLNLFDPPCIVAMATIVREMNNKFWASLAIGYQVFMGYCLSFIVYQLGSYLFYGAAFGLGQLLSCLLLVIAFFLVVRPQAKVGHKIAGAQA